MIRIMLPLTIISECLIQSNCLNFKINDVDIDFEDMCNGETPELDIQTTLCSGLDYSEDSISSDIIQTVINLITLQAITPDEQALGKFTCCKLKVMDT